MSLLKTRILTPIPLSESYIGIDPGTTHFGIAVYSTKLHSDTIDLYEITMTRSHDVQKRLSDTLSILHEILLLPNSTCTVCIEGAAYGMPYRQVELAEQRGALMAFFISRKIPARIIPPTTIRKVVFGNGKIMAQKYWDNIPPNSACALACLLYLERIRK